MTRNLTLREAAQEAYSVLHSLQSDEAYTDTLQTIEHPCITEDMDSGLSVMDGLVISVDQAHGDEPSERLRYAAKLIRDVRDELARNGCVVDAELYEKDAETLQQASASMA